MECMFDMKIYQNNKNGERTSPEFEGETDFFIPVGMVLLEIEECSDEQNRFSAGTCKERARE